MTSKIRVFTRIKPNLNNEKEAYFSYDSNNLLVKKQKKPVNLPPNFPKSATNY